MGIFGFGKKEKFVDLREYGKDEEEKISELKKEFLNEKTETPAESLPFFGMFGAPTSVAPLQPSTNSSISEDGEEKKRRFAKRLTDMTEKIEDLSNQVYHLQQRIEVLERKNNVNEF